MRYMRLSAYDPKTGLYRGRGKSSEGKQPPKSAAADVPLRSKGKEGHGRAWSDKADSADTSV
jgi:hypothetical protein